MAKVKFLKIVTLCGCDVAAGNIDEVDNQSAEALVNEGAAEYVEQILADEADADADAATDEADEALAMTRKALNAQYTRDELADAAKGVGVEFPYTAKKADIVDAIMVAEKYALLLK
jgi:aminopeptidase N